MCAFLKYNVTPKANERSVSYLRAGTKNNNRKVQNQNITVGHRKFVILESGKWHARPAFMIDNPRRVECNAPPKKGPAKEVLRMADL